MESHESSKTNVPTTRHLNVHAPAFQPYGPEAPFGDEYISRYGEFAHHSFQSRPYGYRDGVAYCHFPPSPSNSKNSSPQPNGNIELLGPGPAFKVVEAPMFESKAREEARMAAVTKCHEELKNAVLENKIAKLQDLVAERNERQLELEKKVDDAKKKNADMEAAMMKAKAAANSIGSSDDISNLPIHFKDAIGRNFTFPWLSCRTWKEMEALIGQAFHHDNITAHRARQGMYDLFTPDGDIILPSVWEALVKPGWTITMEMWSIDGVGKEDQQASNKPPRSSQLAIDDSCHDNKTERNFNSAVAPSIRNESGQSSVSELECRHRSGKIRRVKSLETLRQVRDSLAGQGYKKKIIQNSTLEELAPPQLPSNKSSAAESVNPTGSRDSLVDFCQEIESRTNEETVRPNIGDYSGSICHEAERFREGTSPDSSDLESLGSSYDVGESTEHSENSPYPPINVAIANGALSNALGVVQKALVDRIIGEIKAKGNQSSQLRQHTNSGSSPRKSQFEWFDRPCSSGQEVSGDGQNNGRDEDSNDSRKNSEGGSGGINPNSGAKFPSAPGCKRLLACPYFKRNPENHRKYRSCSGTGWKDIHRLKEHLYRRHALPLRCKKCSTVFETHVGLEDHYTSGQPCSGRNTVEDVDPSLGFNKDQDAQLRSRKKDPAVRTEEQKWRKMYRILFPFDPEDSIPSPYCEPEDIFDGKQEFSEWERFEKFSRTEMPNRARSLAESLIGGINQHLLTMIPEVVRQAQDEVTMDYLQRYPDARIPRPGGRDITSISPGLILTRPNISSQLCPSNDFSSFFTSSIEGQFFANGLSSSDSGIGSGSVDFWPQEGQLGLIGDLRNGKTSQHDRDQTDNGLDFTFISQEPLAPICNEQNVDDIMGFTQ